MKNSPTVHYELFLQQTEVMLDIPVCVHLPSSAAPGILWNSTILLCIHRIAFLHFLTHTKRKSWPLRFHSSFFQSFSLSWRFADLNLCSFRDTVILEVRRSLLQARPVCWSRMATRFKTTVDLSEWSGMKIETSSTFSRASRSRSSSSDCNFWNSSDTGADSPSSPFSVVSVSASSAAHSQNQIRSRERIKYARTYGPPVMLLRFLLRSKKWHISSSNVFKFPRQISIAT